MLAGGYGSEKAEEFIEEFREVIAGLAERPAERSRGEAIGAGRASDSKIDTAGIKGFEGAELLSNDEGRVVGEHDPAGADANGFGGVGNVADENRRGGTGDAGHVVVFGEPEASIAPFFGMLGEVEGIAKGFGDAPAGLDGGQIENGIAHRFLDAARELFDAERKGWGHV